MFTVLSIFTCLCAGSMAHLESINDGGISPPFVIEVQEKQQHASYAVCEVPHDKSLHSDYWEMAMGFPRPSRRLPNDRNIKAKVIFVEFPGYPASRSIEQLNLFFDNRYVKTTNDYIEAMSYGQVQHEFYYHDTTIMAELPRTSGPLSKGEDYISEFVRKTLSLADTQIDFSPYDYVIFHVDPLLPLSVANFAWANMADVNKGFVTEEKTFFNMNAWSAETVRPNHHWVAVHEIMHLYGLSDTYHREHGKWLGYPFVGTFDIMGDAIGYNTELLLWNRWFIGWVTPNDIDCLDARTPMSSTRHTLHTTMGNQGTKGIIIRISEYEAILIERKDFNNYCRSCRGGLLVTKYNASIAATNGQLRVVRGSNSILSSYEDAFLYHDDVLEVAGIRIEVIAETALTTSIVIHKIS